MSGPHDLSALSLDDAARRRSFTVDGVRWVAQLRRGYDRRRPDLIFESDATVRRVRDYPADWYELSDDALFSLSWGK